MDNGKAERNGIVGASPDNSWETTPTQRNLENIGKKAIFSPETAANVSADSTPEVEIITLSENVAPMSVDELGFNPSDIHPRGNDISQDTISVIENDILTTPSPSDLMRKYQAARDLYNEADENVYGSTKYRAYLLGEKVA